MADWAYNDPNYFYSRKNISWRDAIVEFRNRHNRDPKALPNDGNNPDKDFFKYFCNDPGVIIKNPANDYLIPCGISIMKTDIWGQDKKDYPDLDIYVPLRKATNFADQRFPQWYGHWLGIAGNAIDHIRIKPINMDLQYVVQDVLPTNNVFLDSGVSHIEATGHFGGVQRKLEVKIDRNTNIPLGIFDFALFSNSPLIPPDDL